jgi:hypothetical protein
MVRVSFFYSYLAGSDGFFLNSTTFTFDKSPTVSWGKDSAGNDVLGYFILFNRSRPQFHAPLLQSFAANSKSKTSTSFNYALFTPQFVDYFAQWMHRQRFLSIDKLLEGSGSVIVYGNKKKDFCTRLLPMIVQAQGGCLGKSILSMANQEGSLRAVMSEKIKSFDRTKLSILVLYYVDKITKQTADDLAKLMGDRRFMENLVLIL